MSEDRKLLELAARAAGFDLIPWETDIRFVIRNAEGYPQKWNPLTDDGDALRLAVKLDMGVNLNRVDEMTIACYGYFAREKVKEEHNDDPYAATRRAIVRAAAEIGKQMEDKSHDL